MSPAERPPRYQLALDLNPDVLRDDLLVEVENERHRFVDYVQASIDRLPSDLRLNDAGPLASSLEAYTNLGSDFIHLLRYYLGVLAYRVKQTEGWGSDAVGRCAESWRIHPTVLRLYVGAAKQTNGRVKLFDNFLRSIRTNQGRGATQHDVETFSSALKDRDVTPEEVEVEIRAQRTDRALSQVQEGIEQAPNPETKRTLSVLVAESAGVQVLFDEVPPPVIVSHETYPAHLDGTGEGFTHREAYHRRLTDLVSWLDKMVEELQAWSQNKGPLKEHEEIKQILLWTETIIDESLPIEPSSMGDRNEGYWMALGGGGVMGVGPMGKDGEDLEHAKREDPGATFVEIPEELYRMAVDGELDDETVQETLLEYAGLGRAA